MRCVRGVAGVLGALAVSASLAAGQSPQPKNIGRHFGGLDGTFVLLEETSGRFIRHNPGRAAKPFPPCSTFKIPHTAILLESGVAPDPTFRLNYDPALKQPANWARSFDLRGAYRSSALWYYQVLARRLGTAEEQKFLRRFDYGNADVSGGLDTMGNPFWVDGSLRISANEQVEFLRRLNREQIGLSSRTTRLTKDIMLAEETKAWRLRAKTGACQPAGEDTSNWYVGWVEKTSGTYYFALQIGAKGYGRAFSQRVPVARAILEDLGILAP
jgi:beta-lactamase class D/beta-lactamase class D OXA-10